MIFILIIFILFCSQKHIFKHNKHESVQFEQTSIGELGTKEKIVMK